MVSVGSCQLCVRGWLPCRDPTDCWWGACKCCLTCPWDVGRLCCNVGQPHTPDWPLGVAVHTHRPGHHNIYTPMQVIYLLGNPASARLLQTLTPESSLVTNPPHPKGGRWMRSNEKSSRILQRWYYSKKQDERTKWHVLGRRQMPSHLTNTHTPKVSALLMTIWFWEGKQWDLKGKEKNKGIQTKVSTRESCYSNLRNWKYFPSLSEWFPYFNFFPNCLWEGYIATDFIWAWGNKKMVNCTA